ncbi:MAG: dipeptide ABC transporter ATP-binding protein [Cyanobacteria bacterium RI_101]|nr:dipeptide ABC transporter ATP-binding protein [Cyanobacteria bacterium RI_101]
MTAPILSLQNLGVSFPGAPRPALGGLNLSLKPGEVLGLVGESGSGKSLTALAILGLLPPAARLAPESEIWFRPAQGEPVNLLALAETEKRAYRGGQIAMIFQEPMSSLNPVYSIGFQLTEAIRLHQNVSPQQARRQAVALLQETRVIPSDSQLEAEFLGAQPPAPQGQGSATWALAQYLERRRSQFLGRYPHQLSGGQLQRVMIAMAISCGPSLLIADEPTTALDVTVQAEILRLLRDLCKTHREMALIFISHDLGVINEIADQVAVMYQGEVVEQGSREQILYQPRHPYTQGLLACRPRLAPQARKLPTVGDFLGQTQAPAPLEIVTPAQERERLELLLKEEPLLRVEGLTVELGQRSVWRSTAPARILEDLSFEVYPGETLGLVGESGCGKSTLARALLGLIPIRSGRVYFDGQDLTRLSPRSRRWRPLRRQMQIIFQNPYNSLNPRRSLGQTVEEPLIIHRGRRSQHRERARYLLERVGLDPDWFSRFPHELSGGQRQRVCIARALALNPRFIICDESVSALDVSIQAQVLNLLKDLQSEFQLTYIFISHDLSVVRFMGDRLMVMKQGRLAEPVDSAPAIINHPKSDYTRRLLAAIPQFPEDLTWLGDAQTGA